MSWAVYDPEEVEHQAALRRETFANNTHLRTPQERATSWALGDALRECMEDLAAQFDMQPGDYIRAKREAL